MNCVWVMQGGTLGALRAFCNSSIAAHHLWDPRNIAACGPVSSVVRLWFCLQSRPMAELVPQLRTACSLGSALGGMFSV